MRENRTYGSEGGETGKPVFPTPIKCVEGVGLRNPGFRVDELLEGRIALQQR